MDEVKNARLDAHASARRWHQSVVARLQIAFGTIAVLTVCACLLALVRFQDAGRVVSRLTDASLPAVKLSLQLENRAASVQRSVSELSRSSNEAQRSQSSMAVVQAFSAFEKSLQQLRETGTGTSSYEALAGLVHSMNDQIVALDATMQLAISRATIRRASVEAVAAATSQLVASLGPAGDAVLAKIEAASGAGAAKDSLSRVIEQDLPSLQAVYDIRTDIVEVANLLNLASSADAPEKVAELNTQFGQLYRRVLRNLEVVIADSNADPARVDELLTTVRKLLAVGTGGNNLFDVRVQELKANDAARARQAETRQIGSQLSENVTRIVADAEADAAETNRLLAAEIASSRWILAFIGLLTILVSLAIGWFFVIRYVAVPMQRLSLSMLDVAKGDLSTELPPVTPDELGDMCQALVVFRDNAREIREARDVAEQARIEAESASRTKSAFLANMSHELRTPLNAIIGYSEMMLEDAADAGDSGQEEDLRKIQTAGKHLLRLINDILDLSKIEAGRMEVYVEPVSLPALVEEIKSLAAPLAAANQNTFTATLGVGVDSCETDITKLKQSLLNLVSNACKFTKQGHVSLSVTQHRGILGEELHFSVRDTGIGMSEDQIIKLFQPFVQADSSTTRQFGGTGLGLAITKQFCRMLGGDVIVTSEPGNGSEFILVLPVAASGQVPAPHDLAESSGAIGATTVLVVDDDKQVHDLIGAMLTREGYRVLHASNGIEAVARARVEKPAAILLDIMMPKIDGWTVLSELKADPDLAPIPVVIVSMLDERPLGLAMGAAEFLSKPVERSKLVSVIQRFAGSAQGTALIVEDQDADRQFLAQVLRSIGMSVETVQNGHEALDWLRVNPRPAALLLDLMMPQLDGFAVLDAIRQDPKLEDVPVIVLTAKELTSSELEFLRGHGGAVITKGPDARATVLGALRQMTA